MPTNFRLIGDKEGNCWFVTVRLPDGVPCGWKLSPVFGCTRSKHRQAAGLINGQAVSLDDNDAWEGISRNAAKIILRLA